MKKLLVLSLVLGIASLATAGWSISAPDTLMPSDIATISIVNDEGVVGGFGGGIAIIIGGPGEWTGDFAVPQGRPQGAEPVAYYGDVSDAFGLPYDLWFLDLTEATTTVHAAGAWFDVNFHCTGEGDVQIVLLNADLEQLDSVTIAQMPEPATMALLGLGALVLRRKK